MRYLLLLCISACLFNDSISQQLTMPANGGSPKAWVGERVGLTDISITYSRPGVKGREGKVFGELVAYGYTDQGFGTSKAAPWRAGADENTTISFSTDVMIEDKKLPAGKYGFFVALRENDADLIFSRNATSWGSYFYDPTEDALKVTVKTIRTNQTVERLKYEFSGQTDNSVVVNLFWEKLHIPFNVKIDLHKTQIESFRRELRTDIGFNNDAWVQAINYSADNNVNLEEALKWSDYAINAVYTGQRTFKTLSAKANVLNKLNRQQEASEVMKQALPLASMQELHNYGRQLLQRGMKKEALEAFQLNEKKHPNNFTTNMGLARGYSANGDYKTALKFARLALPQAPDKPNKDAIEGYIKKLQAGTDIN